MTEPLLLGLPRELIEHIVVDAEPPGAAALAQTCRFFHSLIYGAQDSLIWRGLFLSQIFDDPRNCITPGGESLSSGPYDWKSDVQRRVRAASTIRSPNNSRFKPGDILETLETLVYMITNIPPSTSDYSIDQISYNLAWVKTQLHEGTFLDLLADTDLTLEEQQLRARVHTYFGLTRHDLEKAVRDNNRAFVYDFRNYTDSNYWGPFLQDASGRVNWVHIRAIQHLMSMHALDLDGFLLGTPFIADTPMSLPFCQTLYDVNGSRSSKDDWAGVEGRWQCSFCFIDHRELLLYNQPQVPPELPRDKSLFESAEFTEVFRYLRVNMTITGTERDSAHPNRPRLQFVGSVGNIQTIVGSVFMTDDNQIRWKFLSGEDDQLIWSSEGVQIGAVQSLYGVLGVWTTVFHDDGDPVGPFWLRKIQLSDVNTEEPTADGPRVETNT